MRRAFAIREILIAIILIGVIALLVTGMTEIENKYTSAIPSPFPLFLERQIEIPADHKLISGSYDSIDRVCLSTIDSKGVMYVTKYDCYGKIYIQTKVIKQHER